MADVSIIARLVNGIVRNVDIASNTLVVNEVKVGGGSGTVLTQTILDNLVSLQNGSDFADGTGAHTHDGRYFTESELGSSGASSGSDLIGDDATYSNFTPAAATVKGALSGIDTALATAGGTEFADDVFRVTGSVDASKKVAIEADGLTTSTTRTITMPDANVDLGDIATNNAKVSADGSVTSHSDVTDAGSGAIITSAERSKLAGIEALADVTDADNVDAAGATMNTDTDVSANGWVVDEDNMVSDLATKVPAQQSVKAYVDAEVASAVAGGATFQGDYNASTNSPDLDTSPIGGITKGDMYVVTAAGNFFTVAVEIGDMLIAKQDSPTLEAHWAVVQANLTPASIKTQYESNSDTNAFTDAEQSKLAAISGTNTGDEVSATDSVEGIVELATIAEIDTGTDTSRAITPAGLAGSALQTKVDGIEAGADVTDAANVDAAGATMNTDSSLVGNSYFLDEDNMVSNDATKVASQQSIKAYADTKQPASANLDEADTFFGSTDLSASEAEQLSDGSNADSLHIHSSISDSLTVGQSMPASGPVAVRWGVTDLDTPEAGGKIFLADPTELSLVKTGGNKDPFHVIGLGIAASQAVDASMTIVTSGKLTATAHGFALGEPIFLDSSGALTSTAPTTSGEANVIVGVARDANTIDVRIQIMGVN